MVNLVDVMKAVSRGGILGNFGLEAPEGHIFQIKPNSAGSTSIAGYSLNKPLFGGNLMAYSLQDQITVCGR